MEKKMYEAAVAGNVTLLHELLREDAQALDRNMVGCYDGTPLHIASMLGHAEFVHEIVTRKPELAEKLDSRKSSPLHLTTAKGFLNIVKLLVPVNPEMCFVCDQDGRNPLHIASIEGHVNILSELVQVRPNAARSLTDRGETILHLCVKFNQFEAMKILLEAINNHEFVNSKDDDGNNILHLAVIYKQVEAVKFLRSNGQIEVNALNRNRITALDILKLSIRDVKYREIGQMLQRAGAISAEDMHLPRHDADDWFEKKRNTLMVVASLIATMAFQAGLTPPGGLWQDNSENNSNSTSTDTTPHTAGYSILSTNDSYSYNSFIVTNTIGYMASLVIILLLISGLPCFKRWFFMGVLTVTMWIAILAMGLTYLTGITALASSMTPYSAASFVAYVGLGLVIILLLGHVLRFLLWMKRRPRRTSRADDLRPPRNSV